MRTMKTSIAALAGLALVSTPTVAAAATRTAPPAPQRAATAAPVIDWKSCTGALSGLSCGTMTVPLDHTNPAGGTYTVAVTKRPAATKATGTIFYGAAGLAANPARALTGIDKVLGAAVTDNYDIVAVTPRGVGGSGELRCPAKVKGWPVSYEKTFPVTAQDRALHFEIDNHMVGACKATMPMPINVMTTADSARDLDLARQAVGSPKLHFYGGGYSSILAAQYTQLFPTTIGRVALASALDPVAYSTGAETSGARIPVTERIRTGAAAKASWDAIVKACVAAGADRCDHAATISADFVKAEAGVRAEPFAKSDVYLPYDLTVDTFIEYVNRYMASVGTIPDALDWVHAVAELVAARDAEQAAAAQEKQVSARRTSASVSAEKVAAAKARTQAAREARLKAARAVAAITKAIDTKVLTAKASAVSTAASSAAAPRAEVVREDVDFTTSMAMFGVLCSDTLNPRTQQTWTARDYFVGKAQGSFGQLEMWTSSPCSQWPLSTAKNAYRGDYGVKPANGVLVVANEYDPKMPLSGAQALTQTIKGSRLVTVTNGFGASPLVDSPAAQKIVADYLTGGAMPAADLSVGQAAPLFR